MKRVITFLSLAGCMAVLDFSQVDTEVPGEYQADVTYRNTEYPFTIKVQDTTAPELTGVKNRTIYVGGSINYKKGIMAIDDVDGELTEKIAIDSTNVDLGKEGTYIVTYKVADAGRKA